jgi:6-phosphogluconate dehydrogenase
MRQISSQKATRGTIAAKYKDTASSGGAGLAASLDDLRRALFCAFIVTYAQGMASACRQRRRKKNMASTSL